MLEDCDRRLVAAANLAIQAAGSLLLAFGSEVMPLELFGLDVGNITALPPLIAQREFKAAGVGTVVTLVAAINQEVFAFWAGDLRLVARFDRQLCCHFCPRGHRSDCGGCDRPRPAASAVAKGDFSFSLTYQRLVGRFPRFCGTVTP